jgi:5S rRNA maturation endonuclease (ribonuclease M5)
MVSKRRLLNQRKAFEKLEILLKDIELLVDLVVLEGQRDLEALRNIGFKGNIELYSHVGLSDVDLCEKIVLMGGSVLILSDFDGEGLWINNRLTRILERRGVKVEVGLRRKFGRLMATIGVYAIEDLDNVRMNLNM